MASGIWTTEHFTCSGCGMDYDATREQHSDKHSGSFKCGIFQAEVHAWYGLYDFFDWKSKPVKSPVFGKKRKPTSTPNAHGTTSCPDFGAIQAAGFRSGRAPLTKRFISS